MPATETLAEEFADEAPTERVEGALEQSPDKTRASRSGGSAAETSKSPSRSKKRDKKSKAKPAVVGGSTGYGYQNSQGAGAEEKREAPARSSVRKDSLKVKDIDTRDLAEPGNNPSAGNFSAPPPPKAEPAPSKTTSTSAPSQDADDAKAESKESDAQQAARLHEQARIAAKNKDCTRVLALGQQIRKLDGGYYDRKFLSDDALKSCRASATKKGL